MRSWRFPSARKLGIAFTIKSGRERAKNANSIRIINLWINYCLGEAEVEELEELVVAGFGTGFFFTVFLGGGGGGLSSTITFLGGAAAAAVWAAFTSARRRASSVSLEPERFSMRSAKSCRDFSTAFKSLARDWNSSFEPNAPADSTTEPKTS